MSDSGPTIVWFRADLRVADNPALFEASRGDRPAIGLYIFDDKTPGEWGIGGAAKWWLHHSLVALEQSLAKIGGALVLRQGNAADVLAEVVRETNAGKVYWNRCYEPFTIKRDKGIKETLLDQGIEAKSFNGSLLFEPWTIETKAGGFYKVYTRFWLTCRDKGTPAPPLDAPTHLEKFEGEVKSDMLDDWELLPTSPDWAEGLRDRWAPGEADAMERLDTFLDTGAEDYDNLRNFPAIPATSNISPHLHIGDISPRQIWKITVDRLGWTKETEKFLKEIVWREFAYHVFYYLPEIPEEPMHNRFDAFPWREDTAALLAWQTGQTGYPMVDAGMRELWQTGHMHNRVRMITASFLVKHLLLPWQQGEAWFWDTLVDADLAVNAFSWQWVAGCGADAAPYFRIFNPITQGQKFDPDGTYIRTYVPEIADLPDKYLHTPWAAPDDVLHDAGVKLDETYPRPIIDHKMARERALEAFKSLPKNTVD
jgi:deoxyribodipyrimidine photo-lyase